MTRLMDDFQALKALSKTDLEEKAKKYDLLTPREFAKLIGVHPQQVYQKIRKGFFTVETCDHCGNRALIRVSQAIAALEKRERALGRKVE